MNHNMQKWQQEANDILDEIDYLQDELDHSIYEENIEMYMFDISEAETYFNKLKEKIEGHGGTFERVE